MLASRRIFVAGVDNMSQTEPYVPNQYGCCLHEQLMELCFERGLPQTRTKSSMVQSLAWYDATNTCDRATVWPSWHERDIHRTVSLRAAVDHSKIIKWEMHVHRMCLVHAERGVCGTTLQ